MGVHRQVGLKLLPNTFSPAVCGLLRPTILMPRTLLDTIVAGESRDGSDPRAGPRQKGRPVGQLRSRRFFKSSTSTIRWFGWPTRSYGAFASRRLTKWSLVALGAEARSYGNTLIDIAEMAFLRASPALRLIGVAESRKSLEGRIKHMMTRPIPKSAKVGAAGALVIVVVGALVLPMAAARTAGEQARFVANLPGGATVELVGVCNWPTSEPTCWKADGSSLDQPLRVTKWNQRPGANSYGFILKITGPEDLKRSWRKIEGATGWEASCDVVDRQGNRLDQYTAAIALFEKARPRPRWRWGWRPDRGRR